VRKALASIAARERTKRADIHLGVVLAFIAGAVNAGGFLAVGRYTSHMTGIVSSIGDELALHQIHAALYSFLFLCAFISGAIVSSLIVNLARIRHYHSEFASTLMLEAILLLLFGLSAAGLVPQVALPLPVMISLLCFIMGLQNSLISKVSHSQIRTTHVTGIATDIGVELGRRLFRHLGHPEIPVHAERLTIPLRLLFYFLSGSILGAFAFTYIGFATVVPLAIMLIVLAAPPIWKDLRAPSRH
jgi:uncharacterized membrane protein YoaK (UPF0700 family)